MNKKEMKQWVKEAIEKGYDRSDINELLSEQNEQGKMDKPTWEALLELYDEEKAEVERLQIGFFGRMRLRRGLKKVRKLIEAGTEEIKKISANTKALKKDELKQLAELKEKMIVAIVGNKEKGEEGLNNIFDVRDEQGKEITRRMLESYTIEEIEELLTELVEALEREI